ncbi:MAG: hypothetical protein ACXVXP_05340 [Mycobacteriaceae bacterium]
MFEKVLGTNRGGATAAASDMPARGTAQRVAIGPVAQGESSDLLVIVQ